jgi:putative ABC transport system permease protein
MLENYFKIAFRNLKRHKGFSLINILGLAIGMACCILLLQYVLFEFSYDNFHENADNIYRLQYDSYKNNVLRFSCAASVAAVGQAYKDNFPEVIDFTKLMDINSVIKYEDKVFREQKVQLATPSFLTMFSWKILKGDPETALNESNQILMSESAAKKYFGDEEPIGKSVQIEDYGDFVVTGIFEDVPINSHIKFNIMLSMKSLYDRAERAITSWSWYDFNTYIQLEDGTDPDEFFEKSNNWLQEKFDKEVPERNSRKEFLLQPIKDIHLYSNILEEAEPEENGNGRSVYFLLIIAAFILVIAWINYVNLSTSQAINRSKEVGIRKVVGAFRNQLIGQFVTESVLINLLAAICAIITTFLAIPVFEKITGTPVDVQLFSQPLFWIGVIVIFFIGALISAIYPAIVLSSFKPSSVLKSGKGRFSSGLILRKLLVIFQFTASVVLISGTVIVYKQMMFIQKQDLGFGLNDTLVLWAPAKQDSLYGDKLIRFKDEVKSLPEVNSLTASSNIPGDVLLWSTNVRKTIDTADKATIFYFVGMDTDYLPAYDIDLVAGENFAISQDDKFKIILNTAGIKILGYTNPEEAIGTKVTLYGEEAEVIGVIESYNQMSLKSNPIPLGYMHNETGNHKFLSLKLQEGSVEKTLTNIKSTWNNIFPDEPLDYFFLDEFYNKQYTDENQFGRSFALFSFIAIAVACLGLYGLSAFTVLQRTKEIGIRKVLGSKVRGIVVLLSKDFMKLVLISNIVAIPITYFVMKNWLQNFAYRISIDIWIFVVSIFVVSLIAFSTVFYHTIKAANSNPVKALKYE